MAASIIAEDIARIAQAPLPWDKLHGKTLLITGAPGALPRYMVRTLMHLNDALEASKRCHIIALARNEKKAQEIFNAYLKRDDFSLLVQDVATPIIIERNVQFIVHAASQASPKYYSTDPIGTIDANVLGTRHLLDLAHKHKTESFLFFSSSEIYGQVAKQTPIAETDTGASDPLMLRSCYSESKRLGETMCVVWRHQHQVPVRIVRPFHIYGPGFALDDGRVFADFAANIVNGQDIVMQSDGSAVRSFCYLADATEAFFTVLLKGQAGVAYNVSNPEATVSIAQLAELLVSLFPEKNLRVIRKTDAGYIPSAFNSLVPDIARIKSLGWRPSTGLKDGFIRMINSYQEA